MTLSDTSTGSIEQAPVVAHVRRGEVVESVHHGVVAVVDPRGELTYSVGPAHAAVLPRSSLKPMQSAAMVAAGLDLDGRRLALATASHSGEAFHLEEVLAMLADADIALDRLQNTPDLPLDEHERRAWIAAGREASSLAQNCSGKHAAMLMTCELNGWPSENYLDADHPLQQAVADAVVELTGGPVLATVVDGCGAPNLAVPLSGLARAFGRIAAAGAGSSTTSSDATGLDAAAARVARAMSSAPEYVAGTRRDATALMRAVPGLIAKDGAESVYAVGLPDGTGVALKITDGGERARGAVLAAVLGRLGVPAAALEALAPAPVLGHGRPVGDIVAVV